MTDSRAQVNGRTTLDGYAIDVVAPHGGKLAEYSVDKLSKGKWLLYRSDKKPSTRTHRIIEFEEDPMNVEMINLKLTLDAGFAIWLMDNAENLRQEVTG